MSMLVSYLPHILFVATLAAYRLGVFDRLFPAPKADPAKPITVLESELHDLLKQFLDAQSQKGNVVDLLKQFLDSQTKAAK